MASTVDFVKWRNFANIFLLFLCNGEQFVTAISLLDEYILEAGGIESDCGTDITGKQSVILLSQPGAGLFGGLTSYKADQNCAIIFEADTGILISLNYYLVNKFLNEVAAVYIPYFLTISSKTISLLMYIFILGKMTVVIFVVFCLWQVCLVLSSTRAYEILTLKMPSTERVRCYDSFKLPMPR